MLHGDETFLAGKGAVLYVSNYPVWEIKKKFFLNDYYRKTAYGSDSPAPTLCGSFS